jgi:hypothetical protein
VKQQTAAATATATAEVRARRRKKMMMTAAMTKRVCYHQLERVFLL